MACRRLLQTVSQGHGQAAVRLQAPAAQISLARLFSSDSASNDKPASKSTDTPKKGEQRKSKAEAVQADSKSSPKESRQQQQASADKQSRRTDRLSDALGKRPSQKKPESTTEVIQDAAAEANSTTQSLRNLLSGDLAAPSKAEDAASTLKATDFSLQDGERLGFFSSKPEGYKPTQKQIEDRKKQDEWAKSLKSKTAKIFAEAELIEVGPFDSQRYAPVYADPMAEIRRHTDFTSELKSFKGTKAQKYYLDLVTIALAKNPSYTAEQKHEVVRKTIQYMQRCDSEPLPPMDHLIGFPTPSAKELAKPVKSTRK